MKKTILILCVVAIILTLTGCGAVDEAAENEIISEENLKNEPDGEETSTEDTAQKSANDTSPLNGKKLDVPLCTKATNGVLRWPTAWKRQLKNMARPLR